METCFLALLLANLCFILKGQDLRIEPAFRPFWAKEKDSFNLTCVSEHTARVDLEWVIAGGRPESVDFKVREAEVKKLSNGKVQTSLGLYKEQVLLTDVDALSVVICKTQDGGEEVDASINIISVMARNANVSEGADISIECKALTEMEGLTVTWYRNNRQIMDNDRYAIEGNGTRLIIKESRPQDTGLYKCNMTFPSTVKPGQTILQDVMLSGQPYLTEDISSNVDILLNETLSITCPVAGYPHPDVFWLRDEDTEVQRSERVTFTSHGGVANARIVIKNLTVHDLGEYTCSAENGIGRLVKEFQVGLVGAAVSERAAGLLNVIVGVLFVFLVMACPDLW